MRILVTGASGSLGRYVVRELTGRGHATIAWAGRTSGRWCGVDLRPFDLANAASLERAFEEAAPAVVVHAAALSSIEGVRLDPARAAAVNVDATAQVARLSDRHRVRMLYVSTDMVFGGERAPYGEGAPPAPLSAYGRSKLAPEEAVRALAAGSGLVLRVSLMFGPSLAGPASFFDRLADALASRRTIRLFDDEWRTPLSLAAAGAAIAGLCERWPAPSWGGPNPGLLHLGGPERMSRHEMGRRLAAHLTVDPAPITPVSRESAGAVEPRPRDLSLDSTRWQALFPDFTRLRFEEALEQLGLTGAARAPSPGE